MKPWTAFQDVLLAQAAVQYEKQWTVVAERLGRTSQECQQRYAELQVIGLPRVSPRKNKARFDQNLSSIPFEIPKKKSQKKPLQQQKNEPFPDLFSDLDTLFPQQTFDLFPQNELFWPDMPQMISNTSPTLFLDQQEQVDHSDLFEPVETKQEDIFPQDPVFSEPLFGDICFSSPKYDSVNAESQNEEDDQAEFNQSDNEPSDDESEIEELSRQEVDDLFLEGLEAIPETERQSLSLAERSNINWVNSKTHVFSWEQIHRIRTQLSQLAQIGLQTFAIQSEQNGSHHPETLYWKERVELYPMLRTQGIVHGFKSIYDIKTIEMIPRALQFKFPPPEPRRPPSKNAAPSPTLKMFLDLFADAFDPQLKPQFSQKDYRNRFSDSEDKLLLLGLTKFGTQDIGTIRAYCLPPKSVKEIKTRITNLRYNRKRKESEIKNFMLQPFKPMNESELQLLYHGIISFQGVFRNLCQYVFNYIPDVLIKANWDWLYQCGRVPISWDQASNSFVKSKPRMLESVPVAVPRRKVRRTPESQPAKRTYHPSSDVGYLASVQSSEPDPLPFIKEIPKWNSDFETDFDQQTEKPKQQSSPRPLLSLSGQYDGNSSEQEENVVPQFELEITPSEPPLELMSSRGSGRSGQKRKRRRVSDIICPSEGPKKRMSVLSQ
ncbi:hypothetical protein EDD86DRAFT_201005 [Gorgonomyces haynaldii]|nr:hypothetical protein EDD86DRAFT_201005 [Gorgonomyces haynaldii]